MDTQELKVNQVIRELKDYLDTQGFRDIVESVVIRASKETQDIQVFPDLVDWKAIQDIVESLAFQVYLVILE